MSSPLFKRIAFIGIGHIGSSLMRVMLRDKLAGEIVACARKPETLATAIEPERETVLSSRAPLPSTTTPKPKPSTTAWMIWPPPMEMP